MFLVGNHSGLDLDRDGVVEIPSAATAFGGARNPLFIKLGPTPSGDRLKVVWARSPRTAGGAAQTRVAADGRGGVYVSSAFMESLEFEGGPTLRGAGGNDGFVARTTGTDRCCGPGSSVGRGMSMP